jgi:hypothetical protein
MHVEASGENAMRQSKKKARQVRSNVKSMFIVSFFDIQCTVHKEFVPPGQIVNGKIYREILKRLRDSIRRKRPEKWENNTWVLHHDNAPANAFERTVLGVRVLYYEGRSSYEKNTDRVHLRIDCWGQYFDLRGRK